MKMPTPKSPQPKTIPAAAPLPPLRERKKQKSMAALQVAALQLFAQQGYDATTVEQIAAAADVSPSTFFRYFATKEAVVLYDGLDPVFMESFRHQPAELNAVQALRGALHEVFNSLPTERLAAEQQRGALIRSVPTLRAHMFEEMASGIGSFAQMIAERTGQPADALPTRNLAGAVFGVSIAAFLLGAPDDSLGALDEALAQLESTLAL